MELKSSKYECVIMGYSCLLSEKHMFLSKYVKLMNAFYMQLNKNLPASWTHEGKLSMNALNENKNSKQQQRQS